MALSPSSVYVTISGVNAVGWGKLTVNAFAYCGRFLFSALVLIKTVRLDASESCPLSFSAALAAYVATASCISSSVVMSLPNVLEHIIPCFGGLSISSGMHEIPRNSSTILSPVTVKYLLIHFASAYFNSFAVVILYLLYK